MVNCNLIKEYPIKAAGVNYVELDIIQGKPAHMFPVDKLKKAVEEFTENDIKISALRLPAISTELEKTLELLKTAGINNLIMPLSVNADDFLKQATSAKINISFSNLGISGLYAAGIISKLKAGFVFSPVEFAKAGEKPFLQSFRKGKFRKYIFQLDVEDALFDCTPSILASGNAEIKELISILRCASFSGFMTISGKNINLRKPTISPCNSSGASRCDSQCGQIIFIFFSPFIFFMFFLSPF